MSAFSSRTGGYKAGVILLFVVTAVYVAGVATPYWARTKGDIISGTLTFSDGLWMLCRKISSPVGITDKCATYQPSKLPAWFHAVRALGGLCIAGLVISCVYALATNCCRSLPGPRSRFLEIFTALSGLVGFAGCMVYVGLRFDDDSKLFDTGIPGLDENFYWSFYLAAVGSGLAVVLAILIAVNNKPPAVEPHTGGMVMTTVPAQPGYAPQPYVIPHGAAIQPDTPLPAKADYPAA